MLEPLSPSHSIRPPTHPPTHPSISRQFKLGTGRRRDRSARGGLPQSRPVGWELLLATSLGLYVGTVFAHNHIGREGGARQYVSVGGSPDGDRFSGLIAPPPPLFFFLSFFPSPRIATRAGVLHVEGGREGGRGGFVNPVCLQCVPSCSLATCSVLSCQ